jgi:cell division transport system ATP-binding protein
VRRFKPQGVHATNGEMIVLDKVTLYRGSKVILDKQSLEIKRGELLYLIGASGAGKSSFLKLLYMDLLPDEGEVQIGEYRSSTIKRKDIPYLRRNLGIVFQEFRLFEDRTVYENIAFVLEVTDVRAKEIPKKVSAALSEVGLSQKRNEYPRNLSGGEQQRVAIARALVREPFVLLADEPTGNLDPEVSLEIMTLLKKISLKGIAVVVVTHDYNIVKQLPSRTLRLKNGVLEDVETSPVQH